MHCVRPPATAAAAGIRIAATQLLPPTSHRASTVPTQTSAVQYISERMTQHGATLLHCRLRLHAIVPAGCLLPHQHDPPSGAACAIAGVCRTRPRKPTTERWQRTEDALTSSPERPGFCTTPAPRYRAAVSRCRRLLTTWCRCSVLKTRVPIWIRLFLL